MDRYLNSHNVASPTNVRNYEVSGFTNYRKKSKKEDLKQVKSVRQDFLVFSYLVPAKGNQ